MTVNPSSIQLTRRGTDWEANLHLHGLHYRATGTTIRVATGKVLVMAKAGARNPRRGQEAMRDVKN